MARCQVPEGPMKIAKDDVLGTASEESASPARDG
jgi:hypothetical protein